MFDSWGEAFYGSSSFYPYENSCEQNGVENLGAGDI
jgi:hypothetical protein